MREPSVTTITLSFLSNGLVVEYMPIDYAQRAGRSHFHPIKDAYRYILQVVRMVTFFEPLRVFVPMALMLLFLGGAKFLYDVIGGAITDGDPFALSINTVLLLITGLILFSMGLLADLIVRTSKHSAGPSRQ